MPTSLSSLHLSGDHVSCGCLLPSARYWVKPAAGGRRDTLLLCPEAIVQRALELAPPRTFPVGIKVGLCRGFQ